MKCGPFPHRRLCCPTAQAVLRRAPTPARPRNPFPGFAGYRRASLPAPRRVRGRDGSAQFSEQPSARSMPNTPEGPSASAPGSQTPSMAFTAHKPARHPLFRPEGRGCDDACSGFTHVTDRTVAPAPLRTRPLDHARGHSYKRPRHLPRPDSRRPADTAARRKSALSPTPFGPLAATPFGSKHEAKSSRLRSASETAPLPLLHSYGQVAASGDVTRKGATHDVARPAAKEASRTVADGGCSWAMGAVSATRESACCRCHAWGAS